MSKEMTASETLLNEEIKIREKYGSVVIPLHLCRHYGDLRAKEAVKEFAEELIELYEKEYRSRIDDRIIVGAVRTEHIKHLAKQKGVEI